jgi:FG-GAP repeat protein
MTDSVPTHRRRIGGAVAAALLAATLASPAAAVRGPIQGAPLLYTLRGDATTVNFGWAIAELHDIDGDNVTDLITGDPFRGDGPQAYVYSGATGERLYTWNGPAGQFYAYAIADAGDTNGDGTADILIGNPGDGNPNPGSVELHSGADGSLLHAFAGDQPNSEFGTALASAGDVNGDGNDDVLIGAETSDGPAGTQAGAALIFSGDDFSLIRALHGIEPDQLLGSGTDLAGDLDGDGIRDHIVGGRGVTSGGSVLAFSGASGELLWRFDGHPGSSELGSFFVAGLDDIDGDGTPDVYGADYADTSNGPSSGAAFVLSGIDGSPIYSWTGRAGDGLGPGREAGDIDADGVQDLAVGMYLNSSRATRSGQVQIRSGRTGDVIGRIKSRVAGENLGFDAVGLGDVNGDGRDDLALSAASGNAVYVVSGQLN